VRYALTFLLVGAFSAAAFAAPKAPSPLHVEGRHLVDENGYCVRLRGFMYGPHPFFNGGRWGWGTDDDTIRRCYDFYEKIFKAMADHSQGSYCNMIRMTDDGHWSNDDKLKPNKSDPHFYACDWERYRRYVDKVLAPIAENAVRHGIYVIIRPSYNNPGETSVGCDFQKHLEKEWSIMASNKRLQRLGGRLLFEIQNEPTKILGADGKESESALTDFMQPLVDVIRKSGFRGVILAPGLGYQSWYEPYIKHPLKDGNLGYAVHVYPGWYGQSDSNADTGRFIANFIRQIPVVKTAPIVVTECDWSPEKPGASRLNEFGQEVKANHGTWATASTSKWGVAYKGMMDYFGNISSLLGDASTYMDVDLYLKEGKVRPRFFGVPEAFSEFAFKWYKEWDEMKPLTVAEADAPHHPSAKRRALSTLGELSAHPFLLVNTETLSLCAGAADAYSPELRFVKANEASKQAEYCSLFLFQPIRKKGDKVAGRLRCYWPNGILRLSWMGNMNGDSVNVSSSGDRLFLAPAVSTSRVPYGEDVKNGGVWVAQAVKGGFTFRSSAEPRRYLSGVDGALSDRPVVWKALSRDEFDPTRFNIQPDENSRKTKGTRR